MDFNDILDGFCSSHKKRRKFSKAILFIQWYAHTFALKYILLQSLVCYKFRKVISALNYVFYVCGTIWFEVITSCWYDMAWRCINASLCESSVIQLIREQKTCIENNLIYCCLAKCWPYNRMIGSGECTWCCKDCLLVEMVIISFCMLAWF